MVLLFRDQVILRLRWSLFIKDITKFQWIVELKYVKESDRDTLDKVKVQGLKQLGLYGESKMVQEKMEKDGLKKVLIVVVGKKDIYTAQL